MPDSRNFAFLVPSPTELTKIAAEIGTNGPGFDRNIFDSGFSAEVLAFFRKHLAECKQP